FLQERLSNLADPGEWAEWRSRLDALQVDGLALHPTAGAARPGVVSLMDAFRVAPDFVLLRTTGRSVREFVASNEFRALLAPDGLSVGDPKQVRLIVGGGSTGRSPQQLLAFDSSWQVQWAIDLIPQKTQ